MATFLPYLGPCLGFYSILVTASSGGVCVCSCYSYYGCCGVAGAAIRVTSGAASGIGGACVTALTSRVVMATRMHGPDP